MNFFDTKFLFASMFWSSVAVGYWVYGKRQQAWVPMIGAVVMFAVSCLIPSVWLMSLVCIALMVAVYVLVKQGYG